MKIKTNFSSVLFAAATFLLLSNCSSKENDDSQHQAETTEEAPISAEQEPDKPHFEVDEAFQKQIANVFTSYVDVKGALVTSDVPTVRKEAAKTREALVGVNEELVSGPARNDWMGYMTTIQSSLDEMQASNDIEAQRKAFSRLSEGLYKSIKAFGLGGEDAFYEYCPMAFNNEGAYWLSENDEIRNPYFGDKMLKCGEVKERLQ